MKNHYLYCLHIQYLFSKCFCCLNFLYRKVAFKALPCVLGWEILLKLNKNPFSPLPRGIRNIAIVSLNRRFFQNHKGVSREAKRLKSYEKNALGFSMVLTHSNHIYVLFKKKSVFKRFFWPPLEILVMIYGLFHTRIHGEIGSKGAHMFFKIRKVFLSSI